MQNMVNLRLFVILVSFGYFFSCSSPTKNTSTETTKSEPQLFPETDGSALTFSAEDKWNESWSSKQEVVIQLFSKLPYLHPTNGMQAMRYEIFQYIHATLITEDLSKMGYKPLLLKKMPIISNEGKQLLLELNTKAKFSDGSSISAKDVAFTFKVNTCPLIMNGTAKSNLKNLDSIETKNDSTLVFHYSKSGITNISNLVYYPILQANHYDSLQLFSKWTIPALRDSLFLEKISPDFKNWCISFNSEKFGLQSKIVGLGAYEMVSLNETLLVLELKKDHWQKEPIMKRIVYKVTEDPSVQALEMVRGEVDIVSGLDSKTISKLFENEEVKDNYFIGYVPVFALNFLVCNLQPPIGRNPIFNDVDVRNAIAHLLRVDEVINNLSDGKAQPIASPISILKDEYNHNLKPIAYNHEKAIELLEKAGWRDTDGDGIRDKEIDGKKVPLSFTILCRNAPDLWSDVSTVLLSNMAEAGIEAKAEAVDAQAWGTALTKSKEFDLLLISIGSGYGPQYPLALFDSGEYPIGSNFSGYQNPMVDSLIDLVETTLDYTDRKKILFELQEIFYREQAYLMLTTAKRGVMLHKRFANTTLYSSQPFILASQLRLRNKKTN